MLSEDDNILPAELLLRRILNRGEEIDFTLPRPVQGLAFSPNIHDSDGLSLFREKFSSPEDVARSGRNPRGYYVAQIPASEILDLGVTLVPDPQTDTLPGHSLIPELTYSSSKQYKRELRNKLAQLVNKDPKNRIVFHPANSQ
ncbi:MAG: hypothetical protein DRR42_08200 [Gammaproteobacteria bacterium]|nr:MAG: hypothetical protein DRR42_08200 [Gammaproteobacteria bacterium]